eukprot:gene24377-biopygen1363
MGARRRAAAGRCRATASGDDAARGAARVTAERAADDATTAVPTRATASDRAHVTPHEVPWQGVGPTLYSTHPFCKPESGTRSKTRFWPYGGSPPRGGRGSLFKGSLPMVGGNRVLRGGGGVTLLAMLNSKRSWK